MPDISGTIYHLNREQEERHTQEMAAKLNLPYINLVGYPLTKDVLDLVTEEIAIKHQIIPYLKVGKTVKVGLVRPGDKTTSDFLGQHLKRLGVDFAISVISQSSFLYGIYFYDKLKKESGLKAETAKREQEESFSTEIKDIQSAGAAAKKVSVTRLLDVVVMGAIKTKASDIHLEPGEKDFLIRYRVDGVLQDVVRLSLSQFHQLISRIKYLAQLRMDLANQPQDGRFSVKGLGGENIDLRISIMPTSFGEAVVIRLLGQEKSILELDKLGFHPEALLAIRQAIGKPHGMILTSGPTGSGKSSTLYAVLMELKKPGVKIITLEDPVEYRIEGIEQSQVKPGAGYEFSQGLRASLRQDPDILMVGEIRDADTAEIAIQAALTGHLLISTIHANSAPAVFARFIEMGVKPFLLSGSINLVMAQRLVRKTCPYCREQFAPRPEIWQEIKNSLLPIKARLDQKTQQILDNPKPVLIRGRGCARCNNTGFLGRQVVVEVLVPDETIEALIAKSASISEFDKAARGQGMISMEQDGLIKVLSGSTTVEEVWRVTKD
ncbi:MAG: GspE/PulE family protein [Patescibacteria group bacterium]